MAGHDIVVIGSSAGGISALITLVRSLPAQLPAAIFIVQHIPPHSPSQIPHILERSGLLPVSHPADRTVIEPGHIYVAPPDQHMLLEAGQIRVVRGPRENRSRPAVDPLFRSAAVAYSERVVGIVLTGALDDGTAGLLAIKQCGGIAIVQDPDEAMYSGMPTSAMTHVKVDYVLPLTDIATMVVKLAGPAMEAARDKNNGLPVGGDMAKEVKMVSLALPPTEGHAPPGEPSVYSCPECGGTLWELNDGGLTRFRCRIGHAFSCENVLVEQEDALERALETALKTLNESASLLRKMEEQAQHNGHTLLSKSLRERKQQKEKDAATILRVLLNRKSIPPEEENDNKLSHA